MPELSLREGLRETLRLEMRRNPDLIIFGEVMATMGGAQKVAQGLVDEFGSDRVVEMPVVENVIVGKALGAALAGLTAVGEVFSADFLFTAGSEVLNDIAKWRYQHRWKKPLNLVLRMPAGAAAIAAGPEHSQCIEGYLHHCPGLVVICPGTVHDAIGGLRAAMQLGDPVVFLEHRKLYDARAEVSEEELANLRLDVGRAAVARSGEDLTIVAWSWMRTVALEAAERLAGEGVSVEVIDPRTIKPLDMDAIEASVRKTGRLVVVEESPKTGSVAAEIMAGLLERGIDGRVLSRLALPDIPHPYTVVLENHIIPDADDVVAAVRRSLEAPAASAGQAAGGRP